MTFTPAIPPPDAHVLGQTLTLDGAKGLMRFNRADGGKVVLTRLTLAGERLSKPSESCEVTIAADQLVAAEPAGHPEGAGRWRFPLEACPFSADVLNGAVLVSSAHPRCDFTAADCRVSPVGLWGPPGDSIPNPQIETFQSERRATEAALRTNFKLMERLTGDGKDAEAAFTSERDTACRDYKNESEHGFCATRITEARALALTAQYTARVAEDNARRAAEAAREAQRKAAEDARKTDEAAKQAAAKAKLEAAKAEAEAAKAAALKPATPTPDPVNLLPAPDLALKATPSPAK